jgi:hypothetical protein
MTEQGERTEICPDCVPGVIRCAKPDCSRHGPPAPTPPAPASELPQWAIEEAYAIVTEHSWGWPENASDELTDDQEQHCTDLAASLVQIVGRYKAQPAPDAEAALPLTEDWKCDPRSIPDLSADTQGYIASEVSHDLREGRWDRVRWNVRAMAMVMKALTAAQAFSPAR